MRPQVKITGYADDELRNYTLKTVYRDHANAPAEVEQMSFPSLKELHKGIKKCVAYAKANTYDYGVNFIIL